MLFSRSSVASRLCATLVFASVAIGSHASGAIVAGSKDLGTIWFIGDSITQSNADGDAAGSPRASLYEKLMAGGYTFSFTGHSTSNAEGLPVTGGTASTNLFHYHSGVSGAVIGDNISGRTGITQNVPGWWNSGRLAVEKPDVILIMLGTNDVDQNIDLANAPARLAMLLSTIYAQAGVGNPTIFLGNIPPNRTSLPQDPTNVDAFNAAVPGIVQSFRDQGKDVYFVDQFTPLNTNYATAMRSDNLHTNSVGNDYLAQAWYSGIESRAVPEPSIAAFAALGVATLFSRRRRASRR